VTLLCTVISRISRIFSMLVDPTTEVSCSVQQMSRQMAGRLLCYDRTEPCVWLAQCRTAVIGYSFALEREIRCVVS
jgi:hypothetical protein